MKSMPQEDFDTFYKTI